MASKEGQVAGKTLEGSPDNSNSREDVSGSEDDSHSSADGDKRKFESDEGSDSEAEESTGNKKQKVSATSFTMSFKNVKSSEKKPVAPISIKLGAQKPKEPTPALKKTSSTVANVFNQDSDEEEMPPEAKMRMRNIGRDTPTSAGPNSFGKTRQGFCDMKKVFEKQLKKQMEDISKK